MRRLSIQFPRTRFVVIPAKAGIHYVIRSLMYSIFRFENAFPLHKHVSEGRRDIYSIGKTKGAVKKGFYRFGLCAWLIVTLSSISLICMAGQLEEDKAFANLPSPEMGKNLAECLTKLNPQSGGWCEIRVSDKHPSISSVWPEQQDRRIRMRVGPKSVFIAWNSAAYDATEEVMYFWGGGHTDYGGNEVYAFDINKGQWDRLTEPSPLDHLFVAEDYAERKNKPWRRLCWMPDARVVPGSSHTYDGLIFSSVTKTIFIYSYGPANGSCIEDKEDKFRDSELVQGGRRTAFGWYEFNPSAKVTRNGLAPLSWRKVFDYERLKAAKIHQSYPASVELPNGEIVFGSKFRTVVYDPRRPNLGVMQRFTGQADWGDGLKAYDVQRKLVWSIHKKSLLAFDAKSGRLVKKIEALVDHGKSLAFDSRGRIVSWNGSSNILILDPDEKDPKWQIYAWGAKGPQAGDRRVYGKWIYMPKHDVFVGISTHKTGVWVYRHPQKMKSIVFSSVDPQALIKKAKAGSRVEIPPGTYPKGLSIHKSLEIGLKGVSLRGVSGGKGVVNIGCDNCKVGLEDYAVKGPESGCLSGNCAGVKISGRNFDVTLRRVHIDNAVMGVLTDNRGGTLVVEDSLIENSGLNDKSREVAHNLYAGLIDRLVIRNSTIRRPFGNGHIVKSRAQETLIENSVIVGLDGAHSRTIDFPCGGNLTVRNSVLQHGDNTDNPDIISVGTEPKSCRGDIRPSTVDITDGWIIIDRDQSQDERAKDYGYNRLFNWRAPLVSVNVSGNRIVEKTGRFRFDGEGKIPDMSKRNQMFSSRREAGIGETEIPSVSSR